MIIKKKKSELNELKSKNISSEITQFENKELKELIMIMFQAQIRY